MLLLVITTAVCTLNRILIKRYNSEYEFNSSAILLLSELAKIVVCCGGAHYLAPGFWPKFRPVFVVNALLYGCVNLLT